MENKTNTFESLFERAGNYFETRMELIKLKTVDKTSDAVSSLVAVLVLFFILSVSVIIISIGIALWLGEIIGKSYYGFFIISGFYLVLSFIFYLFRKQLLKSHIANLFIDKVLN